MITDGFFAIATALANREHYATRGEVQQCIFENIEAFYHEQYQHRTMNNIIARQTEVINQIDAIVAELEGERV